MAHFDSNSRPTLACRADAEVCVDKSVSNSGSLANNSRQANSSIPQKAELEKLAKRRFQSPKPQRRGAWWTLLVYRDVFQDGKLKRQRQRIRLAPAAMPVREAQKVASEYLRPLNQGLEAVGSAIDFGHYVTNVYRRNVMSRMSSTTQYNNDKVIRRYLEPAFAPMCLRELTPLTLERYFADLAPVKSYAVRHKIREVLSSILGSAVKYELLAKNPCATVKLGRKPKSKKPHLSPEQFEQLVNEVSEPYATMLFVAVWTGLRVSELVGLRWNDIDAETNSITIDERCSRGDWDQPKTEGSSATIAVHPNVIQRIEELKTLTVTMKWGGKGAKRSFKAVRSSEPNDLVFQSVKTGAPMNDNNILHRHIKPAARKVGLPWANWLCLRRSHATWMAVYAGANPKDVQAQMRHSDIETTMDIYAQAVPESQRRALDQMSRMVATRTAKPEKINNQPVSRWWTSWSSTAGTWTVAE